MAIYGIGGKPGSGKTFWIINHLLGKYFEYNKIHGEWFKKSQFEIISNIEELRLEHYDLNEMVKKAGGKEKFFTVDYQKELLKRFIKVVYIIDEAGSPDWFPVKFSNEQVIFFFQYHRHLGLDFYLIAPGVSNICFQIVRLMEYRLQAKARSKRVANEFRYEKIVEGDRAGTLVLKADERIFKLYKSMEKEETEKVKSVVHKYMIFAGVGFLLAGCMFYYFISSLTAHSKNRAKGDVKNSKSISTLEDKTALQKPIEIFKGGPLSGAVNQGGDLREDHVKTNGEKIEISLDEFKSNYIEVRYAKDFKGGVVIYDDTGRVFRNEDLPFILNDGFIINGKVFVKKGAEARNERASAKRKREAERMTEAKRDGGVNHVVAGSVKAWEPVETKTGQKKEENLSGSLPDRPGVEQKTEKKKEGPRKKNVFAAPTVPKDTKYLRDITKRVGDVAN